MHHPHLKHIDHQDSYQFITFRTYDSTDAFLKKQAAQHIENSKIQFKIDKYLDQSSKGAYLNDEALGYLNAYFLEHSHNWYVMPAFCIMPNHVHLLLKPNMPLAKLMQKIKGQTARELNLHLGKTGTFWAKDYYDKGIRDERHFNTVYKYIQQNPLSLPENDQDKRFYGIYDETLNSTPLLHG